MVNVKEENQALRVNSLLRNGREAYVRLRIAGTLGFGERIQISRMRLNQKQLQARSIWDGKWIDVSYRDAVVETN